MEGHVSSLQTVGHGAQHDSVHRSRCLDKKKGQSQWQSQRQRHIQRQRQIQGQGQRERQIQGTSQAQGGKFSAWLAEKK